MMEHIVGFSGGIDSQACARWVLNRFPAEDVILMNSNAGGNEHPMTEEFVAWYSEHVHPVMCVQPVIADMVGRANAEIEKRGLKPTDPLDFPTLCELKQTFPRRLMQFCTEHLKLQPQLRWIRENITGPYTRYTGVRRQESQNRRDRPVVMQDELFGCQLVNPIVDWTKQMCFDYVKHHSEKINQLYTLGFDRVGCAPCVNAGKKDIRAWAERFPEMIDKVRSWEQRTGRTFFAAMTPRAVAAADKYKAVVSAWKLDARMAKENGRLSPAKPPRPPETLNWIDEVVMWSKTARSGRQLEILMPRDTCESAYGLCE